MVSSIYKKTFSVLMKRPFRLWGNVINLSPSFQSVKKRA